MLLGLYLLLIRCAFQSKPHVKIENCHIDYKYSKNNKMHPALSVSRLSASDTLAPSSRSLLKYRFRACLHGRLPQASPVEAAI